MNKLKLLIPLIVLLFNSGCATSHGPVVRIETPEPAEDFVLICDWHSDSKLNIYSSSALSKRIIHVVKSGIDTPCGEAYSGGRPSSWLLHPVYWGVKKTEEDGVVVYRYTGTKLDYLDKQKEKFETGYWDKSSDPGFEYADNLVGCGFPHQYFDYYSEVKKVDKAHFKRLYHEPILECLRRTIPIKKKYRPAYSSMPDADVRIDKMWNSKKWSKQNE